MDDVKIYSNSTNEQDEFAIQSLENKLNNRPSYSFRIVPAVYAVYTIVVLGVVYTLTIYNNGDILIKAGEKIIDAASAAGRAVMSAASNLISEAKKKLGDMRNPTGRRVRDVEERLKREGFVKQKNNGGSHEKWKHPDGRTVTIPNHVANYEIPIGKLRQIWRDAGWL